MSDTSLAELAIFSLGMMSFGISLMMVMIFLTLLRQQRLLKLNYALYPVHLSEARPMPAASPLLQSFAILQQVEMVDTRPHSEPIPEQWRLPVREGTPDQIVIQIQPDHVPVSQNGQHTTDEQPVKTNKIAAS